MCLFYVVNTTKNYCASIFSFSHTSSNCPPPLSLCCCQVFINPMVASLPEHHHLFARGGNGCFKGNRNEPKTGLTIIHRPCGENEESTLPKSFLPLSLDAEMDERWENLVFGSSKKVTKKKIEELTNTPPTNHKHTTKYAEHQHGAQTKTGRATNTRSKLPATFLVTKD